MKKIAFQAVVIVKDMLPSVYKFPVGWTKIAVIQ